MRESLSIGLTEVEELQVGINCEVTCGRMYRGILHSVPYTYKRLSRYGTTIGVTDMVWVFFHVLSRMSETRNGCEP